MRIQHNIAALNSYRNLTTNNSAVSKNLEKLSSGYRINRAGDDAAGLAISEKMRAQITGLKTAQKNANDGISLVQTAEGAMTEVHSMLNRMVELADQSANGTYANEVDRENLQKEVKSLTEEINRISKSTNFNSINLLDGSLGLNTDTFQINAGVGETPIGTLNGDEVGTITALHKNTGSATAVNPEFTIDLADVKVNLAANDTGADTTATLGLKINGQTVAVADANTALGTASTAMTLTQADGATATSKTGTDIAGILNDKFAVIGNDVYKMSNTGSAVKFEYQGRKKADGTFADKTTADGKVAADTWKPQGNVEITATGAAVAGTENRDNCHVTNVKDPVVGSDVVRSGASLTLTKEIISRGTLTIGDTTFTFDKTKTEAEAAAGTDKKVIGIKDVKDEDLLQTVTRQLSNFTKEGIKVSKGGKDYQFTIGRGNGVGVIEIEEKTQTDSKDYGAFMEAELKAAFSQTSSGVKATNSVTLKDKPKAGDSIKIGDKVYKFGDGKGQVAIGAAAEASAKNLAAAIGSDATANGATVTVSANALGKAAPSIKSAGLTLQIGDTADDFNQLSVEVQSMSADSLGIGLNDINIETQGGAQAAIDKIKTAINTVSFVRGDLGAIQNRLEHTINNLSVTTENMTAAESRIRDVDMAEEMMAYTKNNILVQASQAMLAQANQVPQGVLQLLQ